jgi:hypothetical protein
MVVFHSYIRLPEGSIHIQWGFDPPCSCQASQNVRCQSGLGLQLTISPHSCSHDQANHKSLPPTLNATRTCKKLLGDPKMISSTLPRLFFKMTVMFFGSCHILLGNTCHLYPTVIVLYPTSKINTSLYRIGHQYRVTTFHTNQDPIQCCPYRRL